MQHYPVSLLSSVGTRLDFRRSLGGARAHFPNSGWLYELLLLYPILFVSLFDIAISLQCMQLFSCNPSIVISLQSVQCASNAISTLMFLPCTRAHIHAYISAT